MANPATLGLAAFTSAAGGNDTNRKVIALSLADPQSLNSDSYVENNPIKSVDPDGKGSTATYLYQTNGNSAMVLPLFRPELVAQGIAAGVRYAAVKAIPFVVGGIQGAFSQIASDRFQNKQSSITDVLKTGTISAFTNAQTEGYGLVKKAAGVALSSYLSKSLSGDSPSLGDVGYDALSSAASYGFLNSGSTAALGPIGSSVRYSALELFFSFSGSATKASYNSYRSLTSPTATTKFKEAGLIK